MSGMTLERGLLDALKRLAAATKAEKGGGRYFFRPQGGSPCRNKLRFRYDTVN